MVFNTVLEDGYLCVLTDVGPINFIAVLAFGQTDYNFIACMKVKISTIAQTSGIAKY